VKLILLKTIAQAESAVHRGLTAASRFIEPMPAVAWVRRDGERVRCFARRPVAKAWAVIGSILKNPVYAILAAILPHKTLTTLLSHLNVV